MHMTKEKYGILKDRKFGYRRLHPVPTPGELEFFYKNQYYSLIKKGGRAPELRRLMKGNKAAAAERAWLHSTLYPDICHVLNEHAGKKRVLDIGCGTGEFVNYLKKNGFDGTGIEPSADAINKGRSRGLKLYNFTLEEFAKKIGKKNAGRFDAVTLLNVLEHVPDPLKVINTVREMLNPGGVICVKVPNDFSEIQSLAQKHVRKSPWWIAAPDHINYFNFVSLRNVLKALGFEIIYSQGDFPMELFLLMGDDYVGNPGIGHECHRRRVRFEMSISGSLRRGIYQALADAGIGRDCLVFGRKVKKR